MILETLLTHSHPNMRKIIINFQKHNIKPYKFLGYLDIQSKYYEADGIFKFKTINPNYEIWYFLYLYSETSILDKVKVNTILNTFLNIDKVYFGIKNTYFNFFIDDILNDLNIIKN